MTTKHTPGPWHLSAAKDCIWHQDHGRICTPPNHAQVWNWEPNARLIAAAPELLAALEALLDMDVAYQRGPRVADAVEVARSALAKAKGKQS